MELSRRVAPVLALLVLAGAVPAAGAGPGGTFTLRSSAVVGGGRIPVAYTCDGKGLRPVLKWKGAPKGTKSFALLVDDPDAVQLNFIKPDDTVGDPFVHWIGWGIRGAATSLPGKAPVEGKNDDGKRGWTPFCPQDGTHTFRFRLYALRSALKLKPGATIKAFEAALAKNVLGIAKLTGRYGR